MLRSFFGMRRISSKDKYRRLFCEVYLQANKSIISVLQRVITDHQYEKKVTFATNTIKLQSQNDLIDYNSKNSIWKKVMPEIFLTSWYLKNADFKCLKYHFPSLFLTLSLTLSLALSFPLSPSFPLSFFLALPPVSSFKLKFKA